MGLFDTLRTMFSSKVQLETVELPFSQIDVFISQHSDNVSSVEQKAKQFKQELDSKYKKIRFLLDQLKKAEPAPEIRYSKMCIVANSIRDKFYNDSTRAIGSLSNGIQDFYIDSQAAFKVLNLDMRKAEILLSVYKNEMEEFSRGLIDLKRELDVFKKFVKRDFAVINKYDELKETIVKSKSCRTDIEKAEKELLKIKGELDFLGSKKQGILDKLDELEESKCSPEVLELEKEAKELEEKNKAISTEIDEKFSELKKLLKKFEYLVSQEKYSANQRKIKEYLKSPSQAVLSDYNLDIIKILAEFKKALGEDITLDPKQQIQLPILVDLLTEDYFREKQQEHKVNYGLLQANYSQKTQILTPLVFKERALEREARGLDSNINEVHKDYDKHEKIVTKLREQLEDKHFQLATLVSEVTGLPVKII